MARARGKAVCGFLVFLFCLIESLKKKVHLITTALKTFSPLRMTRV